MMNIDTDVSTKALLLLLVAITMGGMPALAQTGPGGVGNSADNVLWLKADEGIPDADGDPISGWADQSGNGNNPATITGNPIYATNVVNGQPVVRFDGDDELTLPGTLDNVPTSNNTIIVVARRTGTGLDQYVWRQPPAENNQRSLGYNVDANPNTFNFLAASGNIRGNNGARAASNASGSAAFNVLSTGVNGGNVDLVINGSDIVGPTDNQTGGTAVVGQGLTGDVAEVIVYDRRLNASELRVVSTYLSEKYEIGIDTDFFTFPTYRFDVAGIGSAGSNLGVSSSGSHLEAQSSILRIAGSSFDTDSYAFLGHDGKSAAFSNQERPNDDPEVQKSLREWRVDLTGAASKSLTFSADVPADLNGFDDYGIFVDRDGDFSDGADFYDLDLNSSSGLYESSSITINDGDYVVVARFNRRITFEEADRSEFENTTATPNIPITVNYPNRSALSIDVAVTSGENSPTEGSDYITCCASTTTITFPAFVTTFNLNDNARPPNGPEPLEVIDDNAPESNTEFVDIQLQNLSEPDDGVSAGSITDFTYGIVDDEAGDATASVSVDRATVAEGGAQTVTVTVTLSSAAEDGEEVRYELSGDAIPGDDYTPASADGSVVFAAGETTRSFAIDPIDDTLFEGTETVVVTLTGVTGVRAGRSVTLENTGGVLPSASFDITETESEPTVAFSAGAYTGAEGENATLEVELSAIAGTDIEVQFEYPPDPGSDFSPITISPIVIPAGETTQSILLAVDDDTVVEFNETITLEISGATNATLGAQSTADVRLIDNDRIGPNGPGGVGDTENLALWLDARVLDLADGASVTEWPDRSGNGNTAVANSAPLFISSSAVFNGNPAVSFRGNTGEYLDASTLNDLGVSGNTLFSATATRADADQSILSVLDAQDNVQTRGFGYTRQGGGVTGVATQDGVTTDISGLSVGALHISRSQFSVDEIELRVVNNGTNAQRGASTRSGTNAVIGALVEDVANNPNRVEIGYSNVLDGLIGDFAAYRAPLNEAQQTIVSNYLTAKYAVGNVDEYTGDTSVGYGSDVIGVGYVDDDGDGNLEPEEVHAGAALGGLRFDDIGGLDTDGDFLFAGHNTATEDNFVTTTDLTANGGLTLASRIQRAWYADRNSDGGSAITVDITIDLSDTGLGSDPAQDIGLPSNYVLISCADDPNDGDCASNWTEVSSASGVEGDAITFADVTLNDGTFYTIGSSDRTVSPLLTLSLVIEGEVGNEGDAVAGTEGGDAGWRMIGPPIQTAVGNPITAGDLKSDTDPVLIEFDTPFPLFYTWDEANQSFNVGSAATEIPPGRGSIVYILDDLGIDDADPVDPSLVIQPVTGEPTGETEIAADNLPTGLAGDVHFVANPYPYNYDLGALSAGANAFTNSFQADVQAWDPYSSGTDANGNTGSYQLLSTASGSSDIVGTWQAFFVERNGTGTDTEVTFDLAGRSFGDTDPILGGAKSTPQPPKRIELELLAKDAQGNVQGVDRAAWVRFTDAATPEFDVYDATKYTPLAARYVTLAPVGTLRDGTQGPKAVESLPVPTEPVTVDLQVMAQGISSPSFDINVANTRNVPPTWTIELIATQGTETATDDDVTLLYGFGAESDALASVTPQQIDAPSKSSQDQRRPEFRPWAETLEERGHRSPQKNAASKSDDIAPFRLRITPSEETLPVEFARFTGRQAEDNIVLEWSTTSETNNDGFAVEVKRDGAATFDEIGYVRGTGTTSEASSYQFTVSDDLDYGRHTFRLRQVDTDGTASYSKTLELEKTLSKAFDVSETAPNPARSAATLNVTVCDEQPVRVVLYDLLGRRVGIVHDDVLRANDTKQLTIDASRLASGTYFLRVTGESFQETRRMAIIR